VTPTDPRHLSPTRRPWLAAAMVLLAAACSGPNDPETGSNSEAPLHSERGGIGVSTQALAPPTIDASRALAVTEPAVLTPFTLTDVMTRLYVQNGSTGLTPPQLFQQWWDTQNPGPSLGLGAHCNDPIGPFGTWNGYGYMCRGAEGSQAFGGVTMANYFAVGAFLRFDLAEVPDTCGEYRLIFAKDTASPGRNLVIFEAVLPNPRPDLGLEGCRPVANLMKALSAEPNNAVRSNMLRDLFLNGIAPFQPVIHINHLGNNPGQRGQVRTNQFMQANWLLREFKLLRNCSAGPCTLNFAPETDKTNPFGNLFNPASTHVQAPAFQGWFPSAVPGLAVNDINLFNYSPPNQFNNGESDAQDPMRNHYVNQFGGGGAFAVNIQNQLTAMGSPLTPQNVVARAMALSCAGCHQLSNGANLGGGLTMPPSLGFTHVDERFTAAGPNGPRFPQSTALLGTFLPHRASVLRAFLDKTQPLFRLRDPATNGRVYTVSQAERTARLGAGFIDEGNAGFVYPATTLAASPVFRLFDPVTSDRIYTTGTVERSNLIAAGWSDEGTAFHVFTSPAPGAMPLFRLKDPVTNLHVYTVDTVERNNLLSLGWLNEGVLGHVHKT